MKHVNWLATAALFVVPAVGMASESVETSLIPTEQYPAVTADGQAVSGMLVVKELPSSDEQAAEDLGPNGPGPGRKKLNDQQKHELYIEGTITDDQGRVWRFRAMPGSQYAKDMAANGWKSAGKDVAELAHPGFWSRHVWGPLKQGGIDTWHDAKDLAQSAKHWTWDMFADAASDTRSYYKDIHDSNDKLRTDQPLGYHAAIFLNDVKLGLRAIWEFGVEAPVSGAVGLTFGTGLYHGLDFAFDVVEGPVEAGANILGRPLSALGNSLAVGSIAAGSVYVWNGGVWVLVKGGYVPDKETQPWVVLEKDPTAPMPQPYKLDMNGFKALVAASILSASTDSRIADLEKQNAELRAKIQQLEKQEMDERDNRDRAPETAALEKMIQDAMNASQRSVDNDVEVIVMDDTKLEALLDDIATKSGTQISKELKADIIARIKENMSNFAPTPAPAPAPAPGQQPPSAPPSQQQPPAKPI